MQTTVDTIEANTNLDKLVERIRHATPSDEVEIVTAFAKMAISLGMPFSFAGPGRITIEAGALGEAVRFTGLQWAGVCGVEFASTIVLADLLFDDDGEPTPGTEITADRIRTDLIAELRKMITLLGGDA